MSSDSKLQEVTRKITSVEGEITSEKRTVERTQAKLKEATTEHDRAASKLRELELELSNLLQEKHRVEDALKADEERNRERAANDNHKGGSSRAA